MIRNLLESLYRSPLGRMMSRVARMLAFYAKPRMLYGYDDPASGAFRKFTRVSSSAIVMSPERLSIGDYVWVGHYCILDATEGLSIGDGVQFAARVSIFSHGSQTAIRLLGKKYVDIPNRERPGYTLGSVSIGQYTFLGAGSVVLPGVKIGKGCLVAAMSLVTRDVPDYAIVRGQPAKVVGDTREIDAKHFLDRDFSETYYDPDALRWIEARLNKGSKKNS